jgi:isocitrate dehydrogenase
MKLSYVTSASGSKSDSRKIAVAHGDGVGPEITDAVLHVISAAAPNLQFERVEIGERAVRRGATSGIADAAWEAINRHQVLLKGPVIASGNHGSGGADAALREALGVHAKVRPCISVNAQRRAQIPGPDPVIIGAVGAAPFAGQAYRQYRETEQPLALVSESDYERVIRYAFEFARAHGRHRITCLASGNMTQFADEHFHRIFDSVAADFAEIESEHLVMELGAGQLVNAPGKFDVVVTPGFYGDILAAIAASQHGIAALACAASIGERYSMFETLQGAAPEIAGRNLANPAGMLFAAVMMLMHIGERKAAESIHNACLRTIEDGIHTMDLLNENTSKRRVGTREFSQAVADRLGSRPRSICSAFYGGQIRLPPFAPQGAA